MSEEKNPFDFQLPQEWLTESLEDSINQCMFRRWEGPVFIEKWRDAILMINRDLEMLKGEYANMLENEAAGRIKPRIPNSTDYK